MSAMTVSRALRNNSLVKEDTRKRIVETAERLGYIRSPRMGRPAVAGHEAKLKIQLVAGTMGRSMAVFHSRMLITIEQHLAERGYECLIRTCNGDYAQFIQLKAHDSASTAIPPALWKSKLLAAVPSNCPPAW